MVSASVISSSSSSDALSASVGMQLIFVGKLVFVVSGLIQSSSALLDSSLDDDALSSFATLFAFVTGRIR